MTSSVYSVRYSLCVLFYVGVNFILIVIIKNGYMYPRAKIIIPRTNHTILVKHADTPKKLVHEKWKNSLHKTTRFLDICEKHNLSTPLIRRNFLYNSEYNSMYCWIRKAASTSFTKLFSDMANRKITNNYYREVDVFAPKSLNILKNIIKHDKIFKFLIVRHPFERLVSSYRDRLEDNTKYTAQAWIYAKQIFSLTRPHLLRYTETTGSSLHQIFFDDRRLRIVPSFSEFIKWLLQQDVSKDDPHWSRYFKHCSLCEVNYNLILRLDNNTISEINLLYSKIGLNEQRNIDLQMLSSNNVAFTDFARACQYFKELSRNEIMRLYKRYKFDFEMFGYEFDDYLKCASSH